jgi:uncharacterized DUF497 family protein
MPYRLANAVLKAVANHAEHGVSFEEAVGAFADPLSLTIPSPVSVPGESRFLLLGQSARGRLLVVAHRDEGDGELRLISARLATRTERRRYEEDLP